MQGCAGQPAGVATVDDLRHRPKRPRQSQLAGYEARKLDRRSRHQPDALSIVEMLPGKRYRLFIQLALKPLVKDLVAERDDFLNAVSRDKAECGVNCRDH